MGEDFSLFGVFFFFLIIFSVVFLLLLYFCFWWVFLGSVWSFLMWEWSNTAPGWTRGCGDPSLETLKAWVDTGVGSWLERSLLKERGWSSWPCQTHPFWDVLVPNFCNPSCFQISADRQENPSIKPAQRIPSQVGAIWRCSLDFGVLLIYSGWRFLPEVLDFIQYYTLNYTLHEIIVKNLFISTFSPLGVSHKQNITYFYIYIDLYIYTLCSFIMCLQFQFLKINLNMKVFHFQPVPAF